MQRDRHISHDALIFLKTAENSDITAGAAAVPLSALPLSAQDFRGERDIDG
jgi:hypothetical protein